MWRIYGGYGTLMKDVRSPKRLLRWRPYEWELVLSSYGAAHGCAWTRRGCEKQLLMEQGRWFAE